MRKITIENLLKWAFGTELSKVGAGSGPGTAVSSSAWTMVSDFAVLGTLIDRSPNTFGVIPGYIEDGEPHGDALLVGQAVRDLAERGGFEIGDGWNPFPEWDDPHGVIAAEVNLVADELRLKGELLNGRHVVNMVITSAILGRGPDWRAAVPKIEMLTRNGEALWFVQKKAKDRFGRQYTYEVNGRDPRSKRPMKGAYRKWRLARPLRSDIISRLEWQLWQDALLALHDVLSGSLAAHELICFSPDRAPWMRVEKSGKVA